MKGGDWLIGQDRAAAATARIHGAAADLIARHGYDDFTIEALAAKVHCSPATVYRHAGGKAAIRDAVTLHLAARIVEDVRTAIDGLVGSERIVAGVEAALGRMRSEPLAALMADAMQSVRDEQWVSTSPAIMALAQEMFGSEAAEPVAAQWLIRIVLALWFWPGAEPHVESEMLRRFLKPPFDTPNAP